MMTSLVRCPSPPKKYLFRSSADPTVETAQAARGSDGVGAAVLARCRFLAVREEVGGGEARRQGQRDFKQQNPALLLLEKRRCGHQPGKLADGLRISVPMRARGAQFHPGQGTDATHLWQVGGSAVKGQPCRARRVYLKLWRRGHLVGVQRTKQCLVHEDR
ncbi:hypothetical protein NDU88_004853 [Pleurodeles waltl]|uniref:Uncharacterized protein n=1 Tax=Pleurodeles waltl TaxID=8319 RepID=A0AAV7MZL1_PLEWA|nr:hypothetical protein NDU88_004853 [Pleurodeles waltl]